MLGSWYIQAFRHHSTPRTENQAADSFPIGKGQFRIMCVNALVYLPLCYTTSTDQSSAGGTKPYEPITSATSGGMGIDGNPYNAAS